MIPDLPHGKMSHSEVPQLRCGTSYRAAHRVHDKAGTAVPGNQSSVTTAVHSMFRSWLRKAEIYPLALSSDERPSAEPDWAAGVHGRVYYAAVFTRAEPIVGPLSAWLSRRDGHRSHADPRTLPPLEFSGDPPSTYPSLMSQPLGNCPRQDPSREESSDVDLGYVAADRQ